MPPACNTGVHPPDRECLANPQSRFDWYRATVPTSVENLTKHCLDIAGPHARVLNGHGRFNYLYSRTIEDGGDRVATILHGGTNGHPNVEASGERAPALASMLREGGEHRVTRCDVAVDLYGDGLFEQLKDLAGAIADRHRISCRDVTNRNKSEGDTRYLGSRKSAVFARIYEKGKADRVQYGDEESELLKPWVRIELEVKPQKEMKEAAARLHPEAFWGVSAWTSELAKEALRMAPDPIPFHPRRTATDERAFRFMCAQYRNLLQRRCEAIHDGDRDALAAEILRSVFDEAGEAAA